MSLERRHSSMSTGKMEAMTINDTEMHVWIIYPLSTGALSMPAKVKVTFTQWAEWTEISPCHKKQKTFASSSTPPPPYPPHLPSSSSNNNNNHLKALFHRLCVVVQ